MYERLPDKDEPDAFGLSRKDYAHEVMEVWPENWPVFSLFCDIQTQWRAGAMGLIGLDHNVMYRELDDMDLSRAEYAQFKSDIRTMEYAAIAAMNAK